MVGSYLNEPVLFESLESKNSLKQPIFNKITLTQYRSIDIWKMKQSHNGLKNNSEWDEVEIRVHKNYKPHKVSYHQLKNGKDVSYKATCFRCHVNGPRLIRPNGNSKEVKLGKKEKLIISYWNLLIKSYGEVSLMKTKRYDELFEIKEPFRATLKINSCTQCHYKNGPRGVITDSHKETVKFLVNINQMPPWPYKISKTDKKELNRWIYGF